MTIFTACLPRPLRRQSTTKGDQQRIVLSLEVLFNPLLGFHGSSLDSSESSESSSPWKTSQVELSQLIESSEDDERPSTPSRKPRRVSFSSDLENVALIPSHRDMTDNEWDDLFLGCDEIEENARRNRVEFQYEGKDWRTVLEETDFTLCSDGCLYHPITVEIHLRNLRAQQLADKCTAVLIASSSSSTTTAATARVDSKKRKLAANLANGGTFKRLRGEGCDRPSRQ